MIGSSRPRRPRRFRWKRILAVVVSLVVLVAGGIAALVGITYARADTSNVGDLSFENELRIPELDEGVVGSDGVRRFQLDVQAGETEFKPGGATPTWGVNGTYLGPTLRADRGDEVDVAVTNSIDETTTMHWHGMHLPARMDGGPHQPVQPGETWRPTWTIDQPASTLWYHPHPHGETAAHVQRGVAGMFLLDDPEAAALDLPDRYGVDDLPVIIQDRGFDGDNEFEDTAPMFSSIGTLGDEIIVNGTFDPHVDVRDQRVRLRLLNASNARSYDLGFADGRSFQLVGTDGGLLEAPVDLERIPLSPGERAEVVVEFEAGESAVLRSSAPELGGGALSERFSGGDDTFDIVQFRAADELAPSPPLPDALVDVAPADPSDAVRAREFELRGTNINGDDMDMSRIDATVEAGSTEIWAVTNGDRQSHNFHVHDVQFRVLDVDGEAPPARLSGWKDTVATRPGTTTRLLITFGPHADPDWPYMYHCHLLLHEDQGMMGQFVVVEPGATSGRPPSGPGHDH